MRTGLEVPKMHDSGVGSVRNHIGIGFKQLYSQQPIVIRRPLGRTDTKPLDIRIERFVSLHDSAAFVREVER